MKRMFLTSSFSDVVNLLEDFVGEKLEGKTITFIPTACNVEEYRVYVDTAKEELEKLGAIIDVLDIASSTYDEIEETLVKNDYIYVSGGNTFYLLQEIKRKKIDLLLKNLINEGTLYIGESAGSMILSPNIEYVKLMDDVSKAPHLSNYSALDIVDFYPVPHCNDYPFIECANNILKEYKKLNLLPFDNSQVIKVEGNNKI